MYVNNLFFGKFMLIYENFTFVCFEGFIIRILEMCMLVLFVWFIYMIWIFLEIIWDVYNSS